MVFLQCVNAHELLSLTGLSMLCCNLAPCIYVWPNPCEFRDALLDAIIDGMNLNSQRWGKHFPLPYSCGRTRAVTDVI